LKRYYYNIALSKNPLRRTFTYYSHQALERGTRVIVSFGQKKRQIGYVVSVPEEINFDIKKIKPVQAIIDESPLCEPFHLDLLDDVTQYYLSPPGKVYDLLFGITGEKSLEKLKSRRQRKRPVIDPKRMKITLNQSLEDLFSQRLSEQGLKIVQYLMFYKEAFLDDLIEALALKTKSPINTLEKNKIVRIHPSSMRDHATQIPARLDLTREQKGVVEKFFSKRANGELQQLLYGITGSGKTEVYFEIMEHYLENHSQIIFLLPEIGLTPQIIQRVRERFPDKKLSVYHSGLTQTERREAFYRAVHSDIDILLGTRSSVWLPLKKPGLIIVDEEHDESYMQSEVDPVYNCKKVVYKLSRMLNIPVILGSATPLVEDYYKATSGGYSLHQLKKRPKGLRLPDVEMINLNDARMVAGNFSEQVLDEIEKTLREKTQVMLLTGKKGYASYVTCTICGTVLKCPNCDVSLTYHKKSGRLKCHYCGYSRKYNHICPVCGSNAMVFRGFGSERVEQKLEGFFPSARIIRVDRENQPDHASLSNVMKIIERNEADIIVGTRLISKGLNFPNVQLAVILNADQTLFFPDFRSPERTFNLIHQMAGRAGRSKAGARVLIQTYSPEDSAIQFGIENDYEGFVKTELAEREKAVYPPFSNLILIESRDSDSEKARHQLAMMAEKLKEKDWQKTLIMGPAEAFINRISGKFRFHLLVKTESAIEFEQIKCIIKRENLSRRNIHVVIDPIKMIL